MGKILGILVKILFAAVFIGWFIFMLVSASEGVVLMLVIYILILFILGER